MSVNSPRFTWMVILCLLLAVAAFVQPAEAQKIRIRVKVRVEVKTKKPELPKLPKKLPDVIASTGRTLGNLPGNVLRESSELAGKVEKATTKAGKDFTTAINKAGKDTAEEGKRAGKNLKEAIVAISNYTERQIEGYGETLTDAEKRIRQGKFVDALVHLAIDPQLNTEENLSLAVQESKLINFAGSVVATTYGGPQGAAAYAAWTTYRKTGDADLALRVGIITGLSNAGFQEIGEINTGSSLNFAMAKKAALGGALGGMAVAASGGNENEIMQAFLLSGGMILIQDGYQKYRGNKLDMAGAEKDSYCMMADPNANFPCLPPKEAYLRNEQGQILNSKGGIYQKGDVPGIDFKKLDPKRSMVGEWWAPGMKDLSWNHDNSAFMQSVAKVPGMNAMGLFHDKWAFQWDMGTLATRTTIAPAMVIIYMGTPIQINDLIRDTAIESNNGGGGNSSVPVSEDVPDPSFLCIKDELTRAIFTVKGTDSDQLACVVVYQKDNEVKDDLAPWYALKDRDYCKSRAVSLAQDHVERGWSCFVR